MSVTTSGSARRSRPGARPRVGAVLLVATGQGYAESLQRFGSCDRLGATMCLDQLEQEYPDVDWADLGVGLSFAFLGSARAVSVTAEDAGPQLRTAVLR